MEQTKITWEEAWQAAIQYADKQNILHHQPSGIMYERAALDYVKDYLSTRYALYPTGDKWIKVSEALPETMDEVLIWDGYYMTTGYYRNGKHWVSHNDTIVLPKQVTHWQPLPNSPKN